MKLIKVLVLTFIILILVLPFLFRKYPVVLSNRITQHPLYFRPKTLQSYDAALFGVIPFILEVQTPINCNKVLLVSGDLTNVKLGDGTGNSKQDYSGLHMLATSIKCIY